MTSPDAPHDAGRTTGLERSVLETLVHQAGDGLFVVSAQMRVTFANLRGCELTGYTHEELLDRTIADLLDAAELQRRPLRVLLEAPGTVVMGERTLIRKDRSTVPVEITGRRLDDGRLLAVVRDIRERRHTLERLEVQAQALASAASGICFADLEGTVTWANRAFVTLWGHSQEGEVLGREASSFFASQDESRRIIDALRTNGQWMGTFRARRQDDSTFPVDTVASLIRDADGRARGMMASFHDVSSRERDARHIAVLARLYAVLSGVNQAIVRATSEQDLYRSICEVAVGVGGMRMAWIGLAEPDGRRVRAVAHAGHEAGYLSLDFSASADARAGLGPTGRALRDGVLVTTEDIAADVRMSPWREAALERGYRSSAAMPFRRGATIAGTLNLYSREPGFFTGEERALLDEIGAAITFALEAREATAAREALKAELSQAQKMESIGRLAGGVAHDFNNMLSVILGHAELALGTLEPGRAEREDLLQVQEAAHRSAELTRQLLAFARRQPIAPRRLELDDAIAGSLKMLRRLIGEEITLTWRPGPGLWPVVLDPSQLDQLLTNLVVNARDAIGGVGTIEIGAANVLLREGDRARPPELAPGEYVAIAVTDTGSGMDAETMAQIFEPFFTTKHEGQGTGLGLATVYGITRQNGGSVSVASTPGAGSTFTLHLPRAAASAAEALERVEAELPRGDERLLLVEDEAQVRQLTQRILVRLGYTVSVAASPSEALQLISGDGATPDLAVLDVVMPEMNGVVLAERLRAIRPGLRALFVSAYPAYVVSSRGLLGGSMRYLAKPFTARQLAVAVREALDAGGSDA